MAYQNLTFWGYTRVNLEAPVNFNHNIQVLATLMKASEDDESNRRWILALASIGIEYTCLSLFAAVCIGNLHNGKEAMQVEKIPVKLEVNAAERCLESMCCLMDAASSRRFRHVSDIPNTDMTRENAIYDTINDETAYCRMAYGLFAAFSSIRGGSTPMQSPQRWGGTPFGFIDDHISNWGFLKSHIIELKNGKIDQQPDIWCQITVPNEFQKVGKFNIGLTAGIETNLCSAHWIEGCNRMDLILTSSKHSKTVFEESKFTAINNKTGEQIPIELTTPCEVLIEGKVTTVPTPNLKLNDLGDIYSCN